MKAKGKEAPETARPGHGSPPGDARYRHRVRVRGGPSSTQIRVWARCNQACIFCHTDLSLENPAPEVVREAIEAAAREMTREVVLTGGEPTLSPHLADYLELARDRWIPGRTLQSNGMRLADREYAKGLVAAGLNRALISIHTTDAQVHTRIARGGSPELSLQAAGNLIELGVQTEISTVLSNANLGGIDDVVEAVAEHIPKARIVLAITSINEYVPRDWSGVAPRYRDAAPVIARAIRRARELGVECGLAAHCGAPACTFRGHLDRDVIAALAPAMHSESSVGFTQLGTCEACVVRWRCGGVNQHYLKRHGSDELQPLSESDWPLPLPPASVRHRLAGSR